MYFYRYHDECNKRKRTGFYKTLKAKFAKGNPAPNARFERNNAKRCSNIAA